MSLLFLRFARLCAFVLVFSALGQHARAAPLEPLAIETAIGLRHFQVEVMRSDGDRARGLMFRTELGDNEGMLFPSAVPEMRSFWMKNTPLSLDIIFVGPDGRILNIAADTVPYSLDSVRSIGPASAVLELRAGRAKELGIVPGDRVNWNLPN